MDSPLRNQHFPRPGASPFLGARGRASECKTWGAQNIGNQAIVLSWGAQNIGNRTLVALIRVFPKLTASSSVFFLA